MKIGASRWTIRHVVALMLAGLALVAAGAVLFAWSGLYSVAASEGHFAITDKFLRFGMQSSVRAHARGITPPDLSDPNLLPLGAAHYYSGCMPCHGAPGHGGNAVFQQSLPPPPDLRHAREDWRDRELFWLVKHGLKYTGMPAWSARDRDDEQWAVVAFLKRLPDLSQAEYEALALGRAGRQSVAVEEPTPPPAIDIALCARCHGDATSPPGSGLVPRLHGQSEAYLTQALDDYASGARQSGIMQPVASLLSQEQRRTFAGYYAGVTAPRWRSETGNEGGAKLATEGDPGRAIPPCDSCHGADRLASYPGLAGQPAPYLASQLKLWRDGVARSGPLAPVMAPVAKPLTDAEIDALAAHYAAAPYARAP
jgi:cytochrome c553